MNEYLLFFMALIPIVWLIVALGVLKMPADRTCFVTLIITIILAVFFWKMPLINALTASLEGMALATWPIIVVIVAAVFTYNVSLHTKSMDVIKKMMIGITTDRRILVLIIAWGFGGFLESIAGFGTAVAIPASILSALGFDPVFASIICLIANTTPVAFGGIGLPATTLAKIIDLNVLNLSYAISIQLMLLTVLIPILLVIITGKSVKSIKGVLGITLASGLGFAIPQTLAAKYMGSDLPAILGSLCSMAVTILIAKLLYKDTANENEEKVPANKAILAWLPYILIFTFIIITCPLFPSLNKLVSSIKTSILIYQGPGGKAFTFLWLASPGTLILIATFIGGLIQGAKFSDLVSILIKTCKQMGQTYVTILFIVGLAKVMGYSGMIKSIAIVLVKLTGPFYPLIAPVIGALGTFVTGSGTSSNVLFGGLQVEVAKSLGLNPYWLAAANACGATAGKMISPQSIAVATAATGLVGAEGKILSSTLKFCIFYVIVLGIISYFAGPLFGF